MKPIQNLYFPNTYWQFLHTGVYTKQYKRKPLLAIQTTAHKKQKVLATALQNPTKNNLTQTK